MVPKELTEKLQKIRLLAVDVDGVMTDSGMYYTENGDEMKRFNVRDGMGMVLLKKAGFIVGIITTEDTRLLERRAMKLQITDLFQGTRDKVAAMETLMKRHSLSWEQVAFIGDDVNDLELLKRVGFAAAPADATEQNKKLAHYITATNGGDGCVRELCDMILELHGLLPQ